MPDGGVLQSLVSKKRDEMVPEDRTNHRWHDGAAKLLLDASQLSHKHPVVLLDLRMGARLDLTHLVNALYERAPAQVKSKHIAHARIEILTEADVGVTLIKTLRHHICNKKRGSVARCYGSSSEATGTFRTPDAAAPIGLRL